MTEERREMMDSELKKFFDAVFEQAKERFMSQLIIGIITGIVTFLVHTYILVFINDGFAKYTTRAAMYLNLEGLQHRVPIFYVIAGFVFSKFLYRLRFGKGSAFSSVKNGFGILANSGQLLKQSKKTGPVVLFGVGFALLFDAEMLPIGSILLGFIGASSLATYHSQGNSFMISFLRALIHDIKGALNRQQEQQFEDMEEVIQLASLFLIVMGIFQLIMSKFNPYFNLNWGILGIILIAIALYMTAKGSKQPGYMMWIFFIGVGTYVLCYATEVLAHDGGFQEAGGTLSGWLGSEGSMRALTKGVTPTAASVAGAFLGAASNVVGPGFLPGFTYPQSPGPYTPQQPYSPQPQQPYPQQPDYPPYQEDYSPYPEDESWQEDLPPDDELVDDSPVEDLPPDDELMDDSPVEDLPPDDELMDEPEYDYDKIPNDEVEEEEELTEEEKEILKNLLILKDLSEKVKEESLRWKKEENERLGRMAERYGLSRFKPNGELRDFTTDIGRKTLQNAMKREVGFQEYVANYEKEKADEYDKTVTRLDLTDKLSELAIEETNFTSKIFDELPKDSKLKKFKDLIDKSIINTYKIIKSGAADFGEGIARREGLGSFSEVMQDIRIGLEKGFIDARTDFASTFSDKVHESIDLKDAGLDDKLLFGGALEGTKLQLAIQAEIDKAQTEARLRGEPIDLDSLYLSIQQVKRDTLTDLSFKAGGKILPIKEGSKLEKAASITNGLTKIYNDMKKPLDEKWLAAQKAADPKLDERIKKGLQQYQDEVEKYMKSK